MPHTDIRTSKQNGKKIHSGIIPLTCCAISESAPQLILPWGLESHTKSSWSASVRRTVVVEMDDEVGELKINVEQNLRLC